MKHTSLSLFCRFLTLAAATTASTAGADVFSDIAANRVDALREELASDSAAANAATENGVTPLVFAVAQHRLEAAFELLEAGADPNVATPGSLVTPLHRAADKGAADFVRLFLEHGADPAAVAATGFTALHFAARANSAESVKLLLDAGAPVGAADANGRTALHIAAKYDAVGAAEALVAGGAPVSAEDKFGYVPADLASDPGLVDALGGPRRAVAEAPAVDSPAEFADGAEPSDPPAPAFAEGEGEEEEEDEEEEDGDQPLVESWDGNPFHDESLDPATRIRRFHADPGTRLLPDGRSYWGGLRRDRFEGFGVLLSENERERYEGGFHRGKKSGTGTFYYANGDVFRGEFENDAPHGEGEFSFANGGAVHGVWKRGRLWQGSGNFTVSSGARFAGVWESGDLVASRPID